MTAAERFGLKIVAGATTIADDLTAMETANPWLTSMLTAFKAELGTLGIPVDAGETLLEDGLAFAKAFAARAAAPVAVPSALVAPAASP